MNDSHRYALTILHRCRELNTDSRDFKPMSFTELSVKTGLTTSNISKIFSGVQVPTVANFFKLVKALDCDFMVYCHTVPSFIQHRLELNSRTSDNDFKFCNNPASPVYPEYESFFQDPKNNPCPKYDFLTHTLK